MKTTKPLGMRDSPKSFFFFFWPEIGNLLVDSLTYSHDHGELSKSQKEAVKTLIQKKDRDRRLIKKTGDQFFL